MDFHDDGGTADAPVRKMLPNFRRTRLAVHYCLIAACLVGFFAPCTRAENTVTSRKHALSEKLDSIDLEKQLRKRRGESLEDLEKTAELLKDSIAIVKQQLPGISTDASDGGGEKAASASGGRAAGWVRPFQKFLPRTFIDWMVDIIGLIAIISGIVLIIGIFGLVSKSFKKKETPLPRPLHEIFPRSYAVDAYDRIPKVPLGPTEEKDETIASLRKRIEDSPGKMPQDEGVPTATAGESGATDGSTGKAPMPAADDNTRSLKTQVVRAAQQGLDVSEISRRFHLSSDEVSLILRIARKNDSGAR